jgi:hypothetical protein
MKITRIVAISLLVATSIVPFGLSPSTAQEKPAQEKAASAEPAQEKVAKIPSTISVVGVKEKAPEVDAMKVGRMVGDVLVINPNDISGKKLVLNKVAKGKVRVVCVGWYSPPDCYGVYILTY